MKKTTYANFWHWREKALAMGWVHCHDNLVVVDCVENGFCIGEWDSEANKGWLYLDYGQWHDT